MPRLVKKEVNMKVPEDIVSQMQAYMEKLKLTSNFQTETSSNEEEEYEEEGVDIEVNGVYDHRITPNGVWQFKIGWKNSRVREWVDDSDCNCEMMIAKYLKGKSVRTAYLFCRVSTADQATSVNVSLDGQAAELRRAAEAQTIYQRIKVYSISQSAYKNIPKTLSRIGEACLPEDGIFVWRVDRLSRNIVKYLSWMEDLNDRNVILYSHQENISYSKNKLAFLQAVLDAQKEAALLGERIKMSYRMKKERGDEKIGSLPYGKKYHRILRPDGGTLKKIVVDNPEEMAIIDRIMACDYRFSAQIADELNSEGLKKRGRPWTKMSVIRLRPKKKLRFWEKA